VPTLKGHACSDEGHCCASSELKGLFAPIVCDLDRREMLPQVRLFEVRAESVFACRSAEAGPADGTELESGSGGGTLNEISALAASHGQGSHQNWGMEARAF